MLIWHCLSIIVILNIELRESIENTTGLRLFLEHDDDSHCVFVSLMSSTCLNTKTKDSPFEYPREWWSEAGLCVCSFRDTGWKEGGGGKRSWCPVSLSMIVSSLLPISQVSLVWWAVVYRLYIQMIDVHTMAHDECSLLSIKQFVSNFLNRSARRRTNMPSLFDIMTRWELMLSVSHEGSTEINRTEIHLENRKKSMAIGKNYRSKTTTTTTTTTTTNKQSS
jgi:hypothetical protein